MKIKRILAYQVDLPLHEGAYKWSGGKSVEVFDSTIVAVETDDGHVGYGECCYHISITLRKSFDLASMIRLRGLFTQFFRWLIAVSVRAKTPTDNKFTGLSFKVVSYSIKNLNRLQVDLF